VRLLVDRGSRIRFPICMNFRLLSPILLVAVAASTFAADAPKLPAIPSEPIAKKKELLFSDDFERAELGKPWVIVVPTFSIDIRPSSAMTSRPKTA
jgi:hypothetical protein